MARGLLRPTVTTIQSHRLLPWMESVSHATNMDGALACARSLCLAGDSEEE